MMMVAGASLLFAASFESASAGSSPTALFKKGGIWRYGVTGDSTQVDPQLALRHHLRGGWMYATAAKATISGNRAQEGRQLVLRSSTRSSPFDNGRRYTYYSVRAQAVNGAKVTAANFKGRLDPPRRTRSCLAGCADIVDPNGHQHRRAAKKVNAVWQTASASHRQGETSCQSTRPQPDGTVMAKITCVFQATSLKLPLAKQSREVSRRACRRRVRQYYLTTQRP